MWKAVVSSSLALMMAAPAAMAGENVNDTGAAGVEAGFKFYVQDKTFILTQAEYQFLFSDADEIDDQFDDGALFYTLGVGFNF